MAISTQDLVKGLDFEALLAVTGASHNQSIDEARLGPNIGGILESTDTAGVPEVPNPDGTYIGVEPIWWKRYLWRRVLIGSVKYYKWDESAASDPTYLKWIDLNLTAEQALALGISATDTANDALDASNSAVGLAQSAANNANTALITANEAKAASDAVTSQLAALGTVPAGFFGFCAWLRTFSTLANEGWLLCDGSEVSLSVFPNLTPMVGVWGAASAGNVKLPDGRGMTLAGAGAGAYTPNGTALSNRVLGVEGIVGKETHALTAAENAAHKHFIANIDEAGGEDDSVSAAEQVQVKTGAYGDRAYNLTGSATAATLGLTSESGTGAAHNNMQPTMFGWMYIKT